MDFSYKNLKIAAENKTEIGRYKKFPVFAASRYDLNDLGNGAYFILYDDENKLVRYYNDMWCYFGSVDATGAVRESGAKRYILPQGFMPLPQEEPPVDIGMEADVQRSLDIDAVLASARSLTVASLLEGFDYGL